jgi:hypothetical protein
MNPIWTYHFDLVRVLLQWFRPGEDCVKLLMDIGKNLFSSQVFFFVIRDTPQPGWVDLGDQAEVLRMDNKLSSLKAMSLEGVSNVAGDKPLRQGEAVVREIEELSHRGTSTVTACQVLGRHVLFPTRRLDCCPNWVGSRRLPDFGYLMVEKDLLSTMRRSEVGR